MSFLIELILAGVVIFIILAIFGTQLSATAGKKAGKIIQVIDKKYESFIEKKLTFSILNKTELEFDTVQIKKEVITVLKPDIEALISFIAATTNASGVKIDYNSIFFQNLSSLAEKYFRITDEKKTTKLEDFEVQEFYDAVNAGIESDLTNRILDIKTRNY